MMALMMAVLAASVLGSLHCVGMCGPLALWASGVDRPQRSAATAVRLAAYHGGRLLTYSVAGAVAGGAGALLTAGGMAMGMQATAARVVGAAMIAIGIARLFQYGRQQRAVRRRTAFAAAGHAGGGAAIDRTSPATTRASAVHGGRIARLLAGVRPHLNRLPGPLRAAAVGALTTLLPCGWLYLFVLVAGGSGSVSTAVLMMFAFWLGTLPALTALVAGTLSITSRLRPAMPLIGAVVLMATGLYTATGRAAADLAPLERAAAAVASQPGGDSTPAPSGTQAADAQQRLQQLSQQPLPCCLP